MISLNEPFVPRFGADERAAMALTSYLMHKHYCENDVEGLLSWFDDRFLWLGTGENEYAAGAEAVKAIFRQFVGKVPKCNITDEHYDAITIAPGVFLCTGRLWIATDPSTNVYLRVHQRVAMAYRAVEGELRCCHIHISNPYIEMVEGDVGFPTKVARQTYEYLQQCVEEQKKQIAEQTAELRSIYDTVSCGIIRLMRKGGVYHLLTFNRTLEDILGTTEDEVRALDWSRGFYDGIIPEDARRMALSLDALEAPGDVTHVDFQLDSRDGRRLCLTGTNTFISEDERGQIIQCIAFDVTRRVELEETLKRLSYEDTLTGLFNRNSFNAELRRRHSDPGSRLGVACFDINGLKGTNDREGHSAGDLLIHRTAAHIHRVFDGKAYRTGGDEFVVIDASSGEDAFFKGVEAVREAMQKDGLHISAGASWRGGNCDIKEQFDEADRRMYEDKKRFYSDGRHDRRAR